MTKAKLNYILDEHTPKLAKDILEWARWFKVANRVVAKTRVGKLEVSTVFLGIAHAFGNNRPLLFETMVFGGSEDYQERYATWEEAEKGHDRVVKIAANLVAK